MSEGQSFCQSSPLPAEGREESGKLFRTESLEPDGQECPSYMPMLLPLVSLPASKP